MSKSVEFDLAVDLAKYERNMKSAIRTAAIFDADMAQLQKTSRAVDKALNRIDGAVKVDVQADTSALNRAEGLVDALEGMTPKVTLSADTTALDKAQSKVTQIDGATPEVTVGADKTALDKIDGEIAQIDGATPKVDVNVSASGDTEILKQLNSLRTMGVISVGLQIANTARETLSGVPILSSFQDAQRAENLGAARTTEGFTDAENAAIQGAYASGFGESVTDVASTAVMIKQASGDIESSLLPVLQTAVSQGEDVTEVFQAMQSLVASGLAPDFLAAGDALTTVFQNGGNRAGDLLDTIKEYGPQFAAAGVSMEGFFGFLTSGLDAGAFNTDKLADAVKESFTVRLEEGLADPESAPGQVLARLFSPSEMNDFKAQKAAGELTADAYIEAVIARVEEAGTGFDLFELMGSAAEDLTLPVVEALTFNELQIKEGAAADASAAFFNDLGSDLTSLLRTFELEAVETFKVAGQGIDEWVDGARSKIRVLGDELRSGTALPEALEIALEAPGLAESIRQFESVAGNLILGFEEALASIIETFGGKEAAAGLRADIATRGASQLQYDMQLIDDPAQAQQLIGDAVRRGVSPEVISEALAGITGELIERGQTAVADAAIAAVGEVPGQLKVWASGGLLNVPLEYTIDFTPNPDSELSVEEQAASAAAGYAEAIGRTLTDHSFIPPIDTTEAQGMVDGIKDQIAAAFAEGDWATGFNLVDQFMPESRAAYESQVKARLGTFLDTVAASLGDLVITSDLDGNQALGFESMFDFTDASGQLVRFKDATLIDLDSVENRFYGMLTGVELVSDDFEAAFGDMAVASDVSTAQVNAASDLLLLELQTNTDGIVAEINAQRDAYLELGQAAYDAWVAGGMVGPAPATPPGRAAGGDVLAGGMYTVGEQGRELFVPGMDGAIIPHGLTEALLNIPAFIGGGSSVINNTTNIVNVNTNIQSHGAAQLMGNAGRVARSIRGF